MTRAPSVRVANQGPPDTTWTDLELLAEYNRYSTTQRRARFKTKELAIRSIAQVRRDPADTLTTNPPPRPPRPGRRAGQRRLPQNVKARMANQKIEILTSENPYRNEDDSTGRKVSKAYLHYEKMRGGITILEYLAKFTEQEQKNARQYLWNAKNPPPKLVEETDPRTGRVTLVEVPTPPHIRLVPIPTAAE